MNSSNPDTFWALPTTSFSISAMFVTPRTSTRFSVNTGSRAWCFPRLSVALRQATTILYSRFSRRRRPMADTRLQPLTALNAVQQTAERKPVVLACQDSRSGDQTPPSWKGFQSAQHPFSVLPQVFVTDRTVKFGFKNALDYQIIVNWVIAAHKSQGAFQMGMNRADREEFVILESGAADETARTDALFRALAEQAPHPKGVCACQALRRSNADRLRREPEIGSPQVRAGVCRGRSSAPRAASIWRACRARRCGPLRPPGSDRRAGWSKAGGR